MQCRCTPYSAPLSRRGVGCCIILPGRLQFNCLEISDTHLKRGSITYIVTMGGIFLTNNTRDVLNIFVGLLSKAEMLKTRICNYEFPHHFYTKA